MEKFWEKNMFYLARLITLVIDIYVWIIIAEVVISWLIIFDVINTKSSQAKNLVGMLKKATDPVMSRVRQYVPPIGGIDLTPIIVIVALNLLQKLVWSLFI